MIIYQIDKKFIFNKKLNLIKNLGVAGIRVSDSYIQQLLLDHTPSPKGELSCNNASDIRCYFVDFSGYILASNQPRMEVAAGDFLGRVDEQVMKILRNVFSKLLTKYG